MFLTEKYGSDLIAFNKSRRHHRHRSPPTMEAFEEEEDLIVRLRSLLPIPSSKPSISLGCLAAAADLLSATLSAASAVIAAEPPLSESDLAALASHLDAGVNLLDACNAISARIDLLRRRRLLVRLALHLLSSSHPPTSDNLRRARESIGEWEESSDRAVDCSAADLTRSAPFDPPRGKISVVRGSIYAVDAASSLVAGSILAVLGASGELEAVESRVRELAALIDGGSAEVEAEGFRCAVEAAEKATEELTEGLERLSDAVSGLFRSSMGLRNTVMKSFRISPKKCK